MTSQPNDPVDCIVHEGPPLAELSKSMYAKDEDLPKDLTFHYTVGNDSQPRILTIHHVTKMEEVSEDRNDARVLVTVVSTNFNKIDVVYSDDQTGQFQASLALVLARRL